MSMDEKPPGEPNEEGGDGSAAGGGDAPVAFEVDGDGNLVETPAPAAGMIVMEESEEDAAPSEAAEPSRPVTAEFDRTLASGVLTSDDLDVALSELEGSSVLLEDNASAPLSDEEQPITRTSTSPSTKVETFVDDDGPETSGSLDERIRQKLDEEEGRPDTDPLIGMVLGDRFEVLDKIGEGGMGAVYRARQRGIGREVAIKVLLGDVARNKTLVRRFHLEALAISKLKHPNTIQIFDFGETDDGLLYIAMEFLEGTSLQSLLEFEEVLPVQRAIRIARQISQSLREAHGKGIIHRDLKPDNVFLTSVGEESDFVKVLDFGVAKLREEDKKGATVTKTGTIFGTPRYMSPEQAKGKPVDARGDLYAIGIMLYEMVMGHVPFESDNHLGVLILHVQRAPAPFHEARPDLIVPSKLEALVFKLLAKKPEERYQTAEALIRDLDRVEKSLEEIFRRVVRREEALAHGLEAHVSVPTHHDTRLDPQGDQQIVTLGPFRDETVAIEGEEEETPKGASWLGRIAKAAVFFIALGGGFIALLQPLPASYHGIPALATLDVGVQPAARIPWSQVTIASDPAEAEVVRVGSDGTEVAVGKTPLSLRRHRGAPPETYAFSKEGYKRYMRTFEFASDVNETVKLSPARPPAPAPRPRAAAKKQAPKKAAPAPAPKKPVNYNPGKVGTTKSSPY